MPSFFLSRLMQPVSPEQGESGYFSAPTETLDPHLFDGEVFKEDVRQWILDTLYDFWGSRYNDAEDWSTVWIAGSGISYQWSAGRGNGDLDVLIGVDFNQFWQDNPDFQGLAEKDTAEIFNQQFHAELWPSTANTDINGQTYEVTFYVNPNSTDIRNINPYAAYNLSAGEWTVRPPSGRDFEHPKEYFEHADREVEEAKTVVMTYNGLAQQLTRYSPGSPQWHNLMAQAEQVSSQASSMYDSIHLGRKQAFAPGGSGYGDYYNFRWQYHKKNGTAQALNDVAHAHKQAVSDFNEQTYGAQIDGADVLLRRAILWNRGRA